MTLIESIDALLPQTQCGKCGHAGCRPYAQGIVEGEAINKCPPGGDETIAALAHLLAITAPGLDSTRGSAPAQVAFIREAECIGCTKCIQACPVDAIVGAAKFMHTVISEECTGCDLCVAPCPVDCIDMLPLAPNVIPIVSGLATTAYELAERNRKRDHSRYRFEFRNARLRNEAERRQTERLARAQKPSAAPELAGLRAQPANDEALRKARGDVSMCRAQLNKSLKAFGHPPIATQAARLVILQQEYEAAEQRLASLQPSENPVAAAPIRVDNSGVKRAKIQLAMARAALKKASLPDAAPQVIADLTAELHRAELALAAAEQALLATANPPAKDNSRS